MAQFKLIGAVAVKVLARQAARNEVKRQLAGQGVRVSHTPQAVIMAQAGEYLAAHPELWAEALARAHALGMIEPELPVTQTDHDRTGTEKTQENAQPQSELLAR